MDLNRTDGRSISLRIHHNCGLHSTSTNAPPLRFGASSHGGYLRRTQFGL